MTKALDLTGLRFGRLTGVRRAGFRNNAAVWLFRCDCGNEVEAHAYKVKGGHTTSCGCYVRERLAEARTKHGKSGTPLHKAWKRMRDRCNSTAERRPHYAGRGISIAPEWDDFEAFEAWATASGYKPGLELDRVNVDGDYTPQNCRWVDRSTNMRNTRATRFVNWRGERLAIQDAAERAGLPVGTVSRRILALGWTDERALSTPVRKNSRYHA